MFLLHKKLQVNLTKENILAACWEIEEKRTKEYVKKFPDKPVTFQFYSGESVWLAQTSVYNTDLRKNEKHGLFLKNGNDRIDLCLTESDNDVMIWNIGYDMKWTWKRNANLKNELDHWWNKNESKIKKLEDLINKEFESEEEPECEMMAG